MGTPPSAAQRDEAAAAGNVERWRAPASSSGWTSPWADVAAAGEWLLTLAERVRPDVVHLNGYAHAAPAVAGAGVMVGALVRRCRGGGRCAATRRPVVGPLSRAGRARARAPRDQVVAPTAAMLARCGRTTDAGARRGDRQRPRRGALPRPAPRSRSSSRPAACGTRRRTWRRSTRRRRGCPGRSSSPARPTHPDGGSRDAAPRAALGVLAPPTRWPRWLRPRVDLCAARALRAVRARRCWRRRSRGCALVLGDIPSLREIWGDAARLRRRPTIPRRCARRARRARPTTPRPRAAPRRRGRARALELHARAHGRGVPRRSTRRCTAAAPRTASGRCACA